MPLKNASPIFQRPFPIQVLGRLSILFPLCLVLFEFSVYIANDMIQPAMPGIVKEFNTSSDWIPSALTAFILGGGAITWLLGPYSDRHGRKPVFLFGVICFILSSLATVFITDIKGFMILRVLQGMGMCYIGAIGYAAIQEAFAEKPAIRVMALMSNVSLIAPLAGPLLGAWVISMGSWHWIFIGISVLASISFVGLWFTMPETVTPSTDAANETHWVRDLFPQYVKLLGSGRFLRAALTPGFMILPILAWIGLGPMILMDRFGLDAHTFAMWQVPVFGALIGGNLFLAYITGKWPLTRTLHIGMVSAGLGIVLGGVALALGGSYVAIALMTTLICVSDGLSMSVYFRFAMTASDQGKGIVGAGFNIIFTIILAVGIELYKWVYLRYDLMGYWLLSAGMIVLFFIFARSSIKESMADRPDDH